MYVCKYYVKTRRSAYEGKGLQGSYSCMYVCMHVCILPFHHLTIGCSASQSCIREEGQWGSPPANKYVYACMYVCMYVCMYDEALFIDELHAVNYTSYIWVNNYAHISVCVYVIL